MVKMKTLLAAISIASLGMMGANVMADGASIAEDKCASCHGDNGNSKYDKVPNIAGFSETAITDMMGEYKEDDRQGDKFKPDGGDENNMNSIVKDMSDDDIGAVAKFYAGKKFKARGGDFDAKLAKKGAKKHDKKCEKCHSDGGTNPEDDASLLAGQPREYLTKAFDKLSHGDQPMPKKMKKKFKKLSDKDKQSLIEFYVAAGR